jgi:hypothetical protein
VGLRLSGSTLCLGRKQVDGTPRPSRIGGILISFLHKKRETDQDRQFSQLLSRELAEGFPNPKRTGCPDSEFLQRVARHQVPIPEIDLWIDHLGSCSECFGDFNRFRVASRTRGRRRFILYCAAACIVLTSIGLVWQQLSRGREMSKPVAGVTATNPAVVTGDRSGREDVANTGADRKPFEVMLNLTRSATRGAKSTNDSQTIRVPARLLACRMTLPLGSSDGLYYVRVQRAVRNKILKTAQGNATINDGDVRLDVELDLSNMAVGEYLLSYRHSGESWHRVLIVITSLTN